MIKYPHTINIILENADLVSLCSDLANDVYYLEADGWKPYVDNHANFIISKSGNGMFQANMRFSRTDEIRLPDKLRARSVNKVG